MAKIHIGGGVYQEYSEFLREQGISNDKFRASGYLGAVATRCMLPTSLTLANKQQMSRTGHFARDHITELQVVLPNFYVNSSGVEAGSGGPATFTASIEYPAGKFYQLKFNGATSYVAASATLVTTDKLKVNIPKGKKFWVKVWRADALGILYNSFSFFKSNATHGDAFNFTTTTVPDTTLSATATNLDATNIYTPMAIIGQTRRGSVLLLGDSLGAGQNDTPDASGDTGLFRFIGAQRGYINACRPSDRAQWFLASSAIRRSLGQYVTDIVVQHSINDLGSGGRTPAQLESDLIDIGSLLRRDFPSKRLWIGTSPPQAADATNAAPSGINASRIEVNNWKRQIPPPYDGCLELADGLENSRDGGLAASGTYFDVDGTHFTQAGYLAEGTSGFLDNESFTY